MEFTLWLFMSILVVTSAHEDIIEPLNTSETNTSISMTTLLEPHLGQSIDLQSQIFRSNTVNHCKKTVGINIFQAQYCSFL